MGKDRVQRRKGGGGGSMLSPAPMKPLATAMPAAVATSCADTGKDLDVPTQKSSIAALGFDARYPSVPLYAPLFLSLSLSLCVRACVCLSVSVSLSLCSVHLALLHGVHGTSWPL
jgi:hypothetical protein